MIIKPKEIDTIVEAVSAMIKAKGAFFAVPEDQLSGSGFVGRYSPCTLIVNDDGFVEPLYLNSFEQVISIAGCDVSWALCSTKGLVITRPLSKVGEEASTSEINATINSVMLEDRNRKVRSIGTGSMEEIERNDPPKNLTRRGNNRKKVNEEAV